MSGGTFAVELARRERFQFEVDFGDTSWPSLLVDEPEPLGDGAGPGSSRVLAAAIGSCPAASLSCCLDKARVPLEDLRVSVEGASERNEEGRLGIREIKVLCDHASRVSRLLGCSAAWKCSRNSAP